jgi:hypothetical protein
LPKGYNIVHAKKQIREAIFNIKKDKNIANRKELVGLMKCAIATIPFYSGVKFRFYIDSNCPKGVNFDCTPLTKKKEIFFFGYTEHRRYQLDKEGVGKTARKV